MTAKPTAIAISGLAVITLCGDARLTGSQPKRAPSTSVVTPAPPAPPPMTLRPLAPLAAIHLNRRITFSNIPNPPARPFLVRDSSEAFDRARTCLTEAIYFEAAREPEAGQRAVAQVVLNRVRHPAYPGSICAVVYQGATLTTGCQFTFTCDGSLGRPRSRREWARAEAVAAAALGGSVFPAVGYALNYHADYVVPYWATSLAKKAVVNTHIFYRLPGYWGEPHAFRRAYTATEPNPVMLRATALAARRRSERSNRNHKALVVAEADPRIELLGLVELLASGSGTAAAEPSLITSPGAQFGQFSTHAAVESWRQLATADDQLARRLAMQLIETPMGASAAALKFSDLSLPARSHVTGAKLASQLTAFAADTDFATFYSDRRPHYEMLREAHLAVARPLVGRFERYTGQSAGKVRIVIAPLLRDHFLVAGCAPGGGQSTSLNLIAAGGQGNAAEKGPSGIEDLLVLALARRTIDPFPCAPPPISGCGKSDGRARAVREQFAQILAMRVVRSSVDRAASRKPPQSHLTNIIVEAFASYEMSRTWFPSFDLFYPVLKETLARAEARARQTVRSGPSRALLVPAGSTGRSSPTALECEGRREGNA